MKTPLRFQVTESDCGTVALTNAVSYLYEREEIPATLIRAINIYTLDCTDDKGNPGAGGTSQAAIKLLVKWINSYSKNKNFNIKCTRYTNENVTLDKMKECIKNKGVILIRCWQNDEHYAIITDIKGASAYIFDSYYLEEEYNDDSEIKIVLNNIFKYNRVVSLKRLFEKSKNTFALGKIKGRECVLITKF